MLEKSRWAGLDNLIAWLESKNPTEKYFWPSCDHCLFAQYGKSMGVDITRAAWSTHSNPRVADTLYWLIGAGGKAREWTFGQALERAKMYRAHPELLLEKLLEPEASTWYINYVREELGLAPIAEEETARSPSDERVSRELELA